MEKISNSYKDVIYFDYISKYVAFLFVLNGMYDNYLKIFLNIHNYIN